MRKSLFFIASILLSFVTLAGEGSWVQRISLNEVVTSDPYTMFAPSWNLQESFELENRYGLIHLDYTRKSHSDLNFGNEWRVELTLNYSLDGSNYPNQKVLSINSEEDFGRYSDYIKFALIGNGYSVQVSKVEGWYLNSTNNWVFVSNPQYDSHFPLDIDFRMELREEHWYNLDVSTNDFEAPKLDFNPQTYRANWQYLQGAEQYDFEWVWIDQLSQEFTNLSTVPSGMTESEYAFELKKSTRVRVSTTHHVIDKTYPEGRLYFRVRAISKYINSVTGELIDQTKEGEWNYFDPQGNLVSSTISSVSSFEKEKNWLYGIAYAEEGKSVSSVTFYDGSNRGRQSLTYNTSDHITLIGESKFDREGRQTVSVVPAPVLGRSLGYRTGFNLANPDLQAYPGYTNLTPEFDEEDFDFDDYLNVPVVPLLANVSGESGAAQYFSEYNQFDEDLFRAAIPSANGYVYSQTVYRNDGTGRIERVGGIGEEFNVNGDHAVRTYYGSPTQLELQRLFGSNVANTPNGYRKEMVRDANGQYSVTYFDKRGNVIATALAGNAPDNLLALDDQNEQEVTTSLSSNNIIMNEYEMVAEHTHLNTYENDVITLSYDLNGVMDIIGSQTVTIEGQSYPFSELCSSCEYSLKIEVKDQFGNYQQPSIQGTSTSANWYENNITPTQNCYIVDNQGDLQPNPNTPLVASISIPEILYTLPEVGEYRIIKTLSVNIDNMQTNFDDQTAAGGVTNADDFIEIYTANLDYSGCFDNCAQYCEYYQRYLFFEANPNAQPSDWDPADHQQEILQCMGEECDPDELYQNFDPETLEGLPTINPIATFCDGNRERMIAQISPNGVFFENINNAFWTDVNTTTNFPTTLGGNIYQDVNDMQDPLNFNDDLAEYLLTYHREYCHIKNDPSHCDNWAETMNYSNGLIPLFTSQTFASGNVFIDPFTQTVNGYTEDPFNNMIYNGTNLDLLETAVDDYYTYINYAAQTTQLCTSPSAPLLFSGIGDFGSSAPNNSLRTYVAHYVRCIAQADPSYASNLDYYKDLARLTYKSLYDNIKQQLINDFKENNTPACPYFADNYAIFQGPLSEIELEQEVTGGLAELLGGVDCELQALNNAVDWLASLPVDCLEELENSGDYNPGFTLVDLQAPSANPGNIEQLFYDYTIETCPENTWGWFFNPDPNDPSSTVAGQTPSEDGEAEYITIYNLLDQTTGCGTTVIGSFEVDPPTTFSTSVTNQYFGGCFNELMVVLNDAIDALQQLVPATSASITVNSANYPNFTAACNNLSGTFTFGDLNGLVSIDFTPCTSNLEFSFINTQQTISANQIISISNPVKYAAGASANPAPGNDIVVFDVELADGTVVQAYLLGDRLECFDVGNFFLQTITDFSNIFPELPDYSIDCMESMDIQAEINAMDIYNQMLEELENQYLSGLSNCLTSAVENFTMSYTLKEYQYTLYYYDLAGNLVQTVPPQGVDIVPMGGLIDPGTPNEAWDGIGFNPQNGAWSGDEPEHRLETRYKYNGLNTLIAQYTPDGGHSDFILDKLYRVRYSQNARQASEDKASYTKYDELGRVTEAGEMYLGSINNSLTYLKNNAEDNSFPTAQMRMDHTITYYEQGYNDPSIAALFSDGEQKNLRNTIGAIEHFQADYAPNGSTSAPLQGSDVRTVISYSYDPHKNVKEMVSTNYHLESIGQQHKTVRYEYDLISGNVNELIYQQDQVIQLDEANGIEEQYSDEYRHKYHYDANNRLIRAFTSKDGGTTWDKEAKYFYYLHGALARTEIGEDEVQGIDYAYNLQGWLKGVNASSLYASRDLGHDADATGDNQFFGTDVFGFMLSYFDNDYQAIGPDLNTPVAVEAFATITGLTGVTSYNTLGVSNAPSNLYNGNIHNMTTALRDDQEGLMTVLSNNYQYDQLQRIRSMKVYDSPNDLAVNNNFNDAQLHRNGAYQTSYTFDKNGNLKTLARNGNGEETQVGSGVYTNHQMDNFTYYYYDGSGAPNTNDPNELNRLASVVDNVSGDIYDVDIEDSQDQLNNNYEYDESGQLTMDVDEGIQEIVWSVTGKVKEIKFTTASGKNDLKFVYDPMDMRVMKIQYNKPDKTDIKYTYYSYDAQGNTLATYSRTIAAPRTQQGEEIYEDKFYLEENMVYGSSRLGIDNRGLLLTTATIDQSIAGNTNIERAENFVWTIQSNDYYSQSQRIVGRKYYELSNHLGNVLEVISDRKTWIDNNGTKVYSADVISYSDYYPYGMLLPGRNDSETSSSYRYSFQGQEHDDEVKGKGNSINYKYRMHDPRIGRFFAEDPLAWKYPFYSPYQFSGNKVIDHVELEGMEERVAAKEQILFIMPPPTLDFVANEYMLGIDGKPITSKGTVEVNPDRLGYFEKRTYRRSFSDNGGGRDRKIASWSVGYRVTEAAYEILSNKPIDLMGPEDKSEVPGEAKYNRPMVVPKHKRKIRGRNFTFKEKTHSVPTTMTGPSASSRGAGIAGLVLNTFFLAWDYGELRGGSSFRTKVETQYAQIQDVFTDLRIAQQLDLIPPEYKNDASMTVIANFFLTGEFSKETQEYVFRAASHKHLKHKSFTKEVAFAKILQLQLDFTSGIPAIRYDLWTQDYIKQMNDRNRSDQELIDDLNRKHSTY